MKRTLLCIGLLLTMSLAQYAALLMPLQTSGSDNFALNFFEKVVEARGDSSVIVSPLGVSFVLGMLDGGADGQTAQEINHALGAADADALTQWHHQLMATLPTLDDKTELGIANAIVLNSAKGFTLLPTYAAQMERLYEALITSRDFGNPSTLDYINGWGKEQTKGMIPRVLKQLSPNMVSLLMNALYFKGVWSKTFDPELTARDYFLTPDGKYEEVAMMHANGAYPYAANDIYRTVRLDYGNGSYSMYLMLPDWGHTIREVLAQMKETDWMSAPVMTDDVNLAIPQFTSESSLDLTDVLKALGMPTMFDPGQADFSHMADLSDLDGNLFISLFKQVARIEVDENGTKAAAVTVAGVETTAIPNNGFIANRPFLYAIVENTTSTICFMGQFTGKGPDASARPIGSGIPSPTTDTQPESLYDLMGRRLTAMPKGGIYIKDGKKTRKP